jgi:hypothetical protein
MKMNKHTTASVNKSTPSAEIIVRLREMPLDHALGRANREALRIAELRAEEVDPVSWHLTLEPAALMAVRAG